MPLPEKLCSEDELESELHRARSAHLIQRTQDAQRIRERAGSLAESRACAMDIHIAAPRIDSSKARMVEYIEGLCPELQLNALVDRELPANRHVNLPSPEAADKVSGNIAGPGTYGNEGVRIDRPAARTWKCRSEIGGIHPVALRAVNVDRLARNKVHAVGQSLTRQRVDCLLSRHCKGKSASGCKAVVKSPIVNQRIDKAIMPNIRDVVGKRA